MIVLDPEDPFPQATPSHIAGQKRCPLVRYTREENRFLPARSNVDSRTLSFLYRRVGQARFERGTTSSIMQIDFSFEFQIKPKIGGPALGANWSHPTKASAPTVPR